MLTFTEPRQQSMEWVRTDVSMMDRLLVRNTPAEQWCKRLDNLPVQQHQQAVPQYHRRRRQKLRPDMCAVIARWQSRRRYCKRQGDVAKYAAQRRARYQVFSAGVREVLDVKMARTQYELA